MSSLSYRLVFSATLLLTIFCVNSANLRGQGETEPKTAPVPQIKAKDAVIGLRVPHFVIPDTTGKQIALSDFGDAKIVVVVFMGTECPIGNAYVPDLNSLHKRYQDQGVQVIGINSNLSDSAKSIAKHKEEFSVDFPVLVDDEQLAADLFSVRRVPEAYVLDGRRHIRYRGRIDDRVGFEHKRAAAKRCDLEEAVEEVLAGKDVSVASTETEGCLITRTASIKKKGEITYAKHVAKILQDRCASCHHPGTAAPFSLLTYEEARDWSEMIKETVNQRRMPPWDADPRYGKFANDLRMTKDEIDTLVAWIDNGATFGDEKDLPEPLHFEDGWTIGKPDIVFKMPKEYSVQASGTVEYKYFTTPTNFKKDVWVKASEARPGNWDVVHHIIAFIRTNNRIVGALGGFAPGEEPMFYPEGVGLRVPAGAEILWQVHYTPTGKVEKDRSEVGLILCEEKPRRDAKGGRAWNRTFRIPANDGNHRVVSRATFPKDVDLLSLMPHMHLRGKDFRYTAHYPDGTTEILLNVPNYDFNWQHRYRFAKPHRIPKGTTLECVAHFDNSAENPANPDPTKSVTWGDQTWEEMMIGWYSHVNALVVETEAADDETTKKAPVDKPKNPKAEDKPTPAKIETGRVLKRTYDFKEAGKEMEYALYVPKGYDGAHKFPLIVALHGLYSNPRQILGYPGFTKHAEENGYILVAPMGYNSRGWYGSRGKGGGRGSDPKNLGELSEKDVMNVLELVRKDFKIDDDRIYLLGHSMGGGGSMHLAMKYPDIWAAIAPIAPAAYGSRSRLKAAKHIPAIVVQGDKDRLVPVAGTRRWVERMKELDMKHQYIEVKGGGHVMVAWQHFDEIFDFFAAHTKGKQKASKTAESE